MTLLAGGAREVRLRVAATWRMREEVPLDAPALAAVAGHRPSVSSFDGPVPISTLAINVAGGAVAAIFQVLGG